MPTKKTPKKVTPNEKAEALQELNDESAKDLIASSEETAEKVVAQDAERRGDDDPGELDVVDDVAAEQAERRRQGASDEEIANIDAAEAVRLSTEAKMPDTPSGLVKVAVSDARILNLPRAVDETGGKVEVVDGIATVTPEVAAELKLHYPQQVRIL